MKQNTKQNLKEYLTFMLNLNAEAYGYRVDWDADWNTHKKNIKDIFELEVGIFLDFFKHSKSALKQMFNEWISDEYECLINVIANLDYSDNYKLEYFLPKRMLNKSENEQLDYINNQIFALIYA